MAVNPLYTALTGLRVAQAQMGVVSSNISNVSTDGYTRKTLQQYTNMLGNEGAGADVGLVQRHINDILLKDYRTQISMTAGLNVRANYMDQIQTFHGPPDAEQSISAQIGKLKDAFAQLANQPESTLLLNNVFTAAQQTVQKFTDFSDQIVGMRNNTQSEMKQSIDSINALSEQIASLNQAIESATTQNRSAADLEDQRDLAVRDLAQEIDISYFKGENNVLVVMTRRGQQLADTVATPLYFTATPLGPDSYYPASANGVLLGNAVTGTDLATTPNLGGRLGELLRLRDETLPQYQAQIDEVAHKMAMRFDSEGLTLFARPDGSIPANTPGSYVGFAAEMIVNPEIAADNTLLRKGTNPLSAVQDGSSEVLRKIIEYTFGDVAYQQALGTTTITTGPATLFTELGITGQARVIGDRNIQALGSLDTSPFINPGTEDTFTLQVGSGAAQTITITAGMTASALVTAINTAIPGTAQLSSGGQLILTAADDLTIGGGTLGAAGLSELGLTAGVTAASPPAFQIALGNEDPTTISILSTDTGTELLAKINAISGLTATITGGVLKIVPTEGGDISLIDGLGTPLAAAGVSVTDIEHAAFNVTSVGPSGTINTGIQTAKSIHDYATQAVSIQSQQAQETTRSLGIEENYMSTISKEFLDSSGVNLDEEMALLINIQTAYTASARAINAVQSMMDELMNTFR